MDPTAMEESSLDTVEKAREEWERTALQASLQRFAHRKQRFTTLSGIPLEDLYTPLDRRNEDYLRDIGFPGQYPYTRGVHATMYRGRPWTIRQVSGFGTAEDTNQRYKYLLAHGETGLSTDFDLPTLLGRDSDHPLSIAEIGKIGVAIDTLRDAQILWDGIPLGKVSTSMTINSPAFVLTAMYEAVAAAQGVTGDRVTGTVQNDTLKEYTSQNTYIFPPGPSVRLAVDVMENLELFPSIDTIVIGSGDTDFIPLLQKIRARGKNVIVVGFEHSVGSLVKSNCTEFKALTELLGEPEAELRFSP